MTEYTIASLVSVVFVLVADWFSGIRLVTRKAFWVFLAVMYAFMIPVNGYLTSRPIVIYAPEHHLGIRVFTMPVEDFLFGFSLMMLTLLLWEGGKRAEGGGVWRGVDVISEEVQLMTRSEVRNQRSEFSMRIHVLSRKQYFALPLREVFPFFEAPENLGSVTPSWLKFRIITPLPVEMKEGTAIDYTISWLGLPMRWRTLITRYNPPHGFTDIQLKGPYALWEHTHSFREVDGGTEMTDTVRYALPFGFLGSLAHSIAIRRQVEAIFSHRAIVLARHFEPHGRPISLEPA